MDNLRIEGNPPSSLRVKRLLTRNRQDAVLASGELRIELEGHLPQTKRWRVQEAEKAPAALEKF